MKVSYQEYLDDVIQQLEHIEYPYWVQEFEPADVAKALYNSTRGFYDTGISPRMAAIAIFGLTMTYQVLARRPNEIVH